MCGGEGRQCAEAGASPGAAGCAAATKRSAFVLTREPEARLTAEQLASLTGTYASAERGLEAKVEVLEGALRCTLAGQGAVLLVPSSPTRFRVEGLPPGYNVVFQLEGGRATGMALENPGAPPQTLVRKP